MECESGGVVRVTAGRRGREGWGDVRAVRR